MQDIKDTKVKSSDAGVDTQLWRLKHDAVTWTDVTLENIAATSGVAVEAKKEVAISKLTWQGSNSFRRTVLNLVGDKVTVADSSLAALEIDPTQSEVVFQSKAHVFDGSSFSLERTAMTNIKDATVKTAPATQISQLWKVEHDSVKLGQLPIDTIEVAAGIMVVSKSSLVCSEVNIGKADAETHFRKGILDLKSNKAVIENSTIQNIKVDPIDSVQIVSVVGETSGGSTVDFKTVKLLKIEDVKLDTSSETVNTNLVKAVSDTVTMTGVDIQDVSVTSGLAIESGTAQAFSGLKLGGTANKLRRGLLKMKGGAVTIADSSFENVSIDPLSEELVFESQGTTFTVQTLSMANIKDTKVPAGSQAEGSQLWKIDHQSISVAGLTLDTLEMTAGMELAAATTTKLEGIKITAKEAEAENQFLDDLLKISSPQLSIAGLELEKTKLRKGAVTSTNTAKADL